MAHVGFLNPYYKLDGRPKSSSLGLEVLCNSISSGNVYLYALCRRIINRTLSLGSPSEQVSDQSADEPMLHCDKLNMDYREI